MVYIMMAVRVTKYGKVNLLVGQGLAYPTSKQTCPY